MKKLLPLLILLLLLIAPVAYGQSQPPITVREADGSPRLTQPNEIVVPNGSLTVSGRRATLTFSGGGGSGTVTHTVGGLTLNDIITGNGSADLKASGVQIGNVPKLDAANTFSGNNIFQSIGLANTAIDSKKYLTLVKTSIDLTGGDVNGAMFDLSGGGGTNRFLYGLIGSSTFTTSGVVHGVAVGVQGNGNVAAGITNDSHYGMQATASNLGQTNQTVGIVTSASVSGAGANSAELYGNYNTVAATSNANGSLAFGTYTRILTAGGGTLGTVKGLALDGWTGAATTSYGIFIGSSIDIGTTKYAIKSDSIGQSIFAGSLTVNGLLNLGGGANASGIFTTATATVVGDGASVGNGTYIQIDDSTTTIAFNGGVVMLALGPTAARQHIVPNVVSDTFALLAASQAFTNHTYNGLTINSTTGTLALTNGKTETFLKTMSFTAADDTGVYTLPTGTKALLATDGSGAGLSGVVTSIGATSPVTSTGGQTPTIACATCVIASSPGVGIAHFAGSTQTVTSSSIVNADIASGTIDLTAKVTGALPVANGGTGISSFGSGIATFLGTPSSANFLAAINNETGGGLVMGNDTPTIITPTIASFVNATHNHQNAAGGGTLAESALALTDITTNNVSTSAHGFTPKLPNDATKYLDGTGAYSVPAGSGSGANTALSNLASVAINTDLLPASTQGLGNASFPFLASFIGNTTQYESVTQSSGAITHAALGSASNINLIYNPKGNGNISLGLATLGASTGVVGWGGLTSSFAGIGYNGTELRIVKADASAYTDTHGARFLAENAFEIGTAFSTANPAIVGESGPRLVIVQGANHPALASVRALDYQIGATDTSISRISAGLIGVGTGSAGSFAGSLKLTQLIIDKTVTAGGTTGAQTINKTTGTANFAAAATSLVVTNSFVDANSIISLTVACNDATMKSVSYTPGAGSFTIQPNAAPTSECRVDFRITN